MTGLVTVLSFDVGFGAETESLTQALDWLAAGFDARAPGAISHARRVARLAEATARGLGLPDAEIARVRRAASLHDVGKVRTPAAILNKPGPLSEAEFAVVRAHAVVGARMIADSGDGRVAAMVRHHHERFDGAGYPDGLAAERIPFGARIIAVADTFDAVTSRRPYRPAMSYAAALRLLDEEAGAQLDPRVVDVFLARYSGLRGMGALRRVASLT